MGTTKITMKQERLQALASEVGGNLWQKNGMCRIYVEGGNNYHYDGKWWYEIGDDGAWECRCRLTSGYENKNRAEYVKKYLDAMSNDMREAIAAEAAEAATAVESAPVDEPAESAPVEKPAEKPVESAPAEKPAESAPAEKPVDEPIFNKTLADTQQCPPVPIVANVYYTPKNTPIKSVANLAGTQMYKSYQGCGSGVAYVKDKNVVAFHYGAYRPYANCPEGCELYDVDFSAGEICFFCRF
jgi:hypothetical protein